jgi:hypothetical protein
LFAQGALLHKGFEGRQHQWQNAYVLQSPIPEDLDFVGISLYGLDAPPPGIGEKEAMQEEGVIRLTVEMPGYFRVVGER